MDPEFPREIRARLDELMKVAAARTTGIPELDAPETWRERAFGGWRNAKPMEDWIAHQLILGHRASEADYDYDEFLDAVGRAGGDRELDNLDAAFGRKHLGDQDRLNLSTASRTASLAKWLAAARAAKPGRRRLNRAIERRLGSEVGLSEQFLANKRTTDQALLRRIRENPGILRARRFDPAKFESHGWSRRLADLNENSPYDDIVGVSGSGSEKAAASARTLRRR